MELPKLRRTFINLTVVIILLNIVAAFTFPAFLWSLLLFGPIIIIGLVDCFQTKQAIRRNYPVLGNFRYLLESIRPEINQYFVESNSSGRPFSREERSLVYQRSKGALDTLPFGTQKDTYDVGYEWVNHSIRPIHVDPQSLRVTIGGSDCKQPYSASIFNISAMSFGSLSKNAILALSQGAKMGGFAHNTGEGGISSYHLQGGADLIWQIGTAYFGCRDSQGNFCEETFKKNALLDNVKMIEIKISQGAKPGHGGILPGAKVTKEISIIRNVPMGRDVISPPGHSAFTTPLELVAFIKRLRDLSDGKPVGFKLCVGKRREFLAICKAMVKTGITPDFISVDGGEGGTGAAPLEFSNHIGCPNVEGLIFVHNSLVGSGLRDKIKIITNGKITSGFGLVKRISLGADLCYAARAMMLSLGCIQALKCNSNQCPTGVATQDPQLIGGLVVAQKNRRVANYHRETVKSVAEIMGAMGVAKTTDLRPWHIVRRTGSTQIQHYGKFYRFIKKGSLYSDKVPAHFEKAWRAASEETFDYKPNAK